MKKIFGIFAAVFALTAIVFSCQKAEMDEPQAEKTYDKVETVLTAVLEPRTKVALDFPYLSWEDKDQIAVFDGVDSKPNVFTYEAPAVEEGTEEGDAATKAVVASRPSFSGAISEGADATLYAVYPYNEAATCANGKITTTIPAAQVVPEGGNIDKSALLCVASTTTDELNFKNVLGLVRVVVPKAMAGKFTTITIKGANNETVAGTGAITVSATPSFEATAAEKQITLTHAKGSFPEGEYYVAVAPVKFEGGFSISFTKNDGRTGTKSTTKLNEVVRNGGLNVDDQLSAMTWEYLITTKEQLVEWNNNHASWTKNDIVKLGADIDLDGVNWTPHDFPGLFDGDNHKVYNITISRDGYCGFVAALNGTIQNLYLGTSDGEAYDGKSEYVYTPDATAGSWVHMGGVAASINNGALIKNVTNFVKISTPDSDGQAKVCMGGLVSMGTGTSEIQDCVNYGEIVCDASVGVVSGASNHQIGGIMCKTDGKVTITNCKNYGNIYAAGAYVDNVGGIMANPNGNATDKGENKTHIKGCYNYGNITITKTTSEVTPMALGGIVGKLTGATVEDCHNEGNISSVCDVLTGIGGVVGIHKLDFESKITSCSNGVLNATDKGILSFNPEEGTQQMVIGGILGYSEHGAAGKLTIQSSNNYAPIDVSYGKFRNIGGICGVVGDFTSSRDGKKSSVELLIDDCHNYGAVTVTSATSYTTEDAAWQKHIGGVVGILYGSDNGVTVSNSSNEATLHSTATGTGETRIAGIVAHTRYGNITISTCTNNGEVKADESATSPRPAGIVSVAATTTSTSITGCNNNKMVSSASSVGNVYIGGIGAHMTSAQISECHNNAVVEVANVAPKNNAVNIGGIAGHLVSSGKISQCTNTSTVKCAVPLTTAENRIGGIAGNIESSTLVEQSRNTATGVVIVTNNTYKPRIGGIVGRNSGGLELSYCDNEGKVTTSAVANGTTENQNEGSYIGGVIGWSNKGVNYCNNKGTVEATACAVSPSMGGILGVPSGNITIKNCKNTSTGKVTSSVAALQNIYVGGIVSTGTSGIKIQYCYNEGEVKINQKAKNSYVGGIVGLGLGTVENCENSSTGSVINEHPSSNTTYALAGGIAGKCNGGMTIQNCTSSGTVQALINTSNKLSGAGGIIGHAQNNVVLKNNENHGSVIGTNPRTDARIYVGGIVATDGEKLEHSGVTTMTGNSNYGTVTLTTATPAATNGLVDGIPGAAAGGIFGLVFVSTLPTEDADYNLNHGTVTANIGADDKQGKAGALAGASSIAAWSGKVGKGTVVNGVAWSESVAASWLCPSAVNALSATYVDAIQ